MIIPGTQWLESTWSFPADKVSLREKLSIGSYYNQETR